jgi:hypothetical protein
VREAVKIPVCMSSLLQLPIISASLAPSRPIAVITADGTKLTNTFLARAGINVPNPIIIQGLENQSEFKAAVLDEKGSIDSALVEAEVVSATKEIKEAHPDLGAVLFECSMLPPYARAVQDSIGLPIFDFITMIDFLRAATHQKRYDGFY